MGTTLAESTENLREVADDPKTAECLANKILAEVVADKGYHSNDTCRDLAEVEIRSYVSEPDRGRRDWDGKTAERDAVYANRRRIRGQRGKRLLRKRGELVERPFAHCYETGGMRRTHLQTHRKILKRLLVHVAGFNLALVMRSLFGIGKPRRLQDGLPISTLRVLDSMQCLLGCLQGLWERLSRSELLLAASDPQTARVAAA